MRRIIPIFLAAALLVTLFGCQSAPAADASLDSDRAFIHYGLFEQVCATEDTVYFTSGDLVHYYDKTTGISGILCGKAECEHSTATGSSCNAYIGSVSKNLQLYNGRLYWIKRAGSFAICSMALDGTDHRTDRTVERGFFASNTGNWSAVFHRGALYVWIVEYAVTDGETGASFDMAVIPLDPDEEPYMVFQEGISYMATTHGPHVVMQGYQDDVYLLTSIAGSYEDDPDGSPDFYNLQIRRYNAAAGELTTLYHDSESPIVYTVEMWAMDDGIVFLGYERQTEDGGSVEIEFGVYRLDFESGELTKLFSPVKSAAIVEDLVVCSQYDSERTNPSNPWGLTLAPQDIERSGEFHVILRNFAGEVLLDGTYPLEGHHQFPSFCGTDGTYAYFLSDQTYGDNDGTIKYMSLIGVALDGSGMEILSSQEESYRYPGTHGTSEHTRTLDDGTVIIVKDRETITIIPGDGGETVTMTIEELLENGYQP